MAKTVILNRIFTIHFKDKTMMQIEAARFSLFHTYSAVSMNDRYIPNGSRLSFYAGQLIPSGWGGKKVIEIVVADIPWDDVVSIVDRDFIYKERQ